MVSIIEKSIINLLSDYSIASHKINGAPGVYVEGSKIAALGLKVKRGKTYHGLSLNIDMDLAPYRLINPCLLYTSPSPRDRQKSRMPSSA